MLEPIDKNAAPKASPIKLTKRTVESLEPGPASVVRYDDKLSGFGVRIMPSGRRFYFVRYRNKYNRSRWFSIGEHGKITADIARLTAQRVLQEVVVNKSDPSGERESFRSAPTVSDLFDRYISEHVERKNRPVTRKEFKRIVERDLGIFDAKYRGRFPRPAISARLATNADDERSSSFRRWRRECNCKQNSLLVLPSTPGLIQRA